MEIKNYQPKRRQERKEKLCYFAINYEDELRKAKKNPKAIAESYKLPDGRVVELVEERFMAPEIMYNPTLIGSKIHALSNPDTTNKYTATNTTTKLPKTQQF